MAADSLYQHRADRLISVGRAMLAFAALATVSLDPPGSGSLSRLTESLLVGYAVYALILGAAIWMGTSITRGIGVFTHALDMILFTLLLYLTHGPASPYFLFFIFALLSATLKWRWKGALWTTLAILLVFIPTGLGLYRSFSNLRLDIQPFVLRLANLLVVGGILVFFGRENERIAEEILKLGTPPPELDDLPPPRQALEYAATIFNVPRTILVWEDPEEPWVYLAERNAGEFHEERIPLGAYSPLIAEGLNSTSFLYQERGGDALYRDEHGALAAWRTSAINEKFAARYRIGNAVSIPIQADDLDGRLFSLDVPLLSAEVIATAAAAASQITATLNREAAAAAKLAVAASEQRLHLARDLHDGVLQFLAGMGMQLEGITRSAKLAGTPVDPRLSTLQGQLAAEQKELREFIRQLRPAAPARSDGALALREDLEKLRTRLSDQWNIEIDLTAPQDALVPQALGYDIHQLIREAVANAVRHGAATHIDIEGALEKQVLNLRISDNGTGMSPGGTFTAEELAALKAGPRSLRERTSSLGGTFTLSSSSKGTIVAMSIPAISKKNSHVG
jgi:signal transduction histidine kinase